jgi:3D (Asp-Asp-Asp) domain-containing protein
MNGHGSFVVTSLFCALISTLVGFGAHKAAKIESRERYLPRIEALDEERQELARQVAELERMRIKEVTVTAYSPTVAECGPDPQFTASMVKVRPGIVAVSRDLFDQGWVFGKKVYVKGHGIFEIADLMHKRHTQRMDIFFPDTKEARRFGVKQIQVALLES